MTPYLSLVCTLLYQDEQGALTRPPACPRHCACGRKAKGWRKEGIDEGFKFTRKETSKKQRKKEKSTKEEERQKGKKEQEKRPVFALDYDPRLPSMQPIQAKHWRSMVNQDQYLAKVFPKPPLTAFRRKNNLRSLLIRSKVPIKPKVHQERFMDFSCLGWFGHDGHLNSSHWTSFAEAHKKQSSWFDVGWIV